MNRIAILAPRLDKGDATGNDAVEMLQVFQKEGYRVRLFAEKYTVNETVYHPEGLDSFLIDPEDILIYHYAVFWAFALELFRKLKCKKILRYHNVTPARYYEPYHESIARNCREGVERLKDFIESGVDHILAASEFNKRDLIASGVSRQIISVVPPFHKVGAMLQKEMDMEMFDQLHSFSEKGRDIFLMVGRVVPNKAYEHLLHAFGRYSKHYNQNARLLIIGNRPPELIQYHRKLDTIVYDSGIEHAVQFAGVVSDNELKSAYLSARAFVITSEHEGFCVPIIEAMASGTPVIAYGSTAIPETAGEDALVWDTPDSDVFAASMDTVSRQQDVASFLSRSGRDRYQNHFQPKHLERMLKDSLRKFIA